VRTAARWRLAPILTVLALVAACGPTVTIDGKTQTMPLGTTAEQAAEAQRLADKMTLTPKENRARLSAIAASTETLAPMLSNSTARSYDLFHGSQIEYLAADGTTQLWYPGNRGLVAGRWQLRQTPRRTQMCFAYGGNTYNPATKTFGGKWECGPARLYLLHLEELVPGDPLGLRPGKLPFVLPKGEITINEALRMAKKPAAGKNKISW